MVYLWKHEQMKNHDKTVSDLNLKTGDIVLFSGRCKVARMIQVLTLCKWSHVGMIIDDPVYGICSYESTHNDNWPGLDIGRKTQGVQLVKLANRLEGYKGDIAIMRLNGVSLSEYDLQSLMLFRQESVGKPFENNFFEAFLSMFKWIKNKGDFDYRFCTEHVGGAWRAMDIISNTYDLHKITPADFRYRRVKMKRGRLGKPFIIKKYKK